MTLLRERLEEAMSEKEKDISTFLWKGSKKLDEKGNYVQQEHRMVDLNDSQLLDAYEHCKTMLYNKNHKRPGRYVVLDMIQDQKHRTGAELFIRWVISNHTLSRYSLSEAIVDFENKNREVMKEVVLTISNVIENIPDEYSSIPVDIIRDGCLDRLGTFDKKHITRTFILKQGVWFTSQEAEDLTEYNSDGSERNRLDVIRERLNIKPIERLFINSKGLSYSQLRAMLQLGLNKKYMDLTTMQLETIRNRMLFELERTVKYHIDFWKGKMEEIELVLNSRGIPM